MSTVYSVRIPKQLREALDQLKHINWQDELRAFLEQKARAELLREGLKHAHKVRASTKRTLNAARMIRADREHVH